MIIDSSTSQLCGTKQASLNLDVLTCQMGVRMAVGIKGDKVCKSDHCTALGLSLPESPGLDKPNNCVSIHLISWR